MEGRLSFGAFAWILAAAPAWSQSGSGPLDFDLVEVNDQPGAQHPGIEFVRHSVGLFAAESGGSAVVDFDEDGDLDVFLTDTEGWPNHLYVNNGDGTFSEEAQARGVAQTSQRRGSALFFDMENDGDLDLWTCGYPSTAVLDFDLFTLYRNDGAPEWSFTEVTESAGEFVLDPTQEGTILGEPGGACAGDYTGDGYLDLFVTYWYRSSTYLHDQPRIFRSTPNPDEAQPGQADWSPRVYRDDTIETGLDAYINGSLWMPTFLDYDRDGHLDVHINVEWGYDVLRLNQGDGTFGPDIATAVGLNGDPAETRNEMGSAFGDIDFDGDLDSYHTNALMADRLYRNDSTHGEAGTSLEFTDVAPVTGTAASILGFGTVFVDVDHDRDLDLFAVGGIHVPVPNFFFENRWPELAADGVTPAFGDLSTFVPDFQKDGAESDIGRGMTAFDYDLDGDLDFLVTRPGVNPALNPGTHPAAGLYRNTLEPGLGGWLQVDLRETGGSRNTLGARVYLKTGELVQHREVLSGVSFLSQQPYRLHFGLGAYEPDWLVVRWLDGSVQVVQGVAPGRVLRVERKPVDATGDLDGDGAVSWSDLAVFDALERRPAAVAEHFHDWPAELLADVNGDATVDGLDLALLVSMMPPFLPH